VLVSAHDTTHAGPVVRQRDPPRVGGHGLELVRAVGTRLVVERTTDGKAVTRPRPGPKLHPPHPGPAREEERPACPPEPPAAEELRPALETAGNALVLGRLRAARHTGPRGELLDERHTLRTILDDSSIPPNPWPRAGPSNTGEQDGPTPAR